MFDCLSRRIGDSSPFWEYFYHYVWLDHLVSQCGPNVNRTSHNLGHFFSFNTHSSGSQGKKQCKKMRITKPSPAQALSGVLARDSTSPLGSLLSLIRVPWDSTLSLLQPSATTTAPTNYDLSGWNSEEYLQLQVCSYKFLSSDPACSHLAPAERWPWSSLHPSLNATESPRINYHQWATQPQP